METPLEHYCLDLHCTQILEDYRANRPVFEKIKEIVTGKLRECINRNNVYITALESRIKTEGSLAGKLDLKGHKYGSIFDLTDIVGARVITFYNDEVDKISALIDKIFEMDWENSVDKRLMHELNSFGYNSLHYICRIPKSMYYDPDMPQLNEFRFEIQLRTAMQHVWATMYHDTGYKSGIDVPKEYIRNLNRLAGMLELIDEQFSLIRTNINDYRRKMQSFVADGRLDEVPINVDTFRSFMTLKPFDKLCRRIAATNQAEIHETSLLSYLDVFHFLRFRTLGDIKKLIEKYSDDAYHLAVYEIASTDLDIISNSVAVQDLVIVYIVRNGMGESGLRDMFELLGENSEYSAIRAGRTMEKAKALNLVPRK